jgi:hypothetical protein
MATLGKLERDNTYLAHAEPGSSELAAQTVPSNDLLENLVYLSLWASMVSQHARELAVRWLVDEVGPNADELLALRGLVKRLGEAINRLEEVL